MLKLLNSLFGPTNKSGTCRFWNHTYGDRVREQFEVGTGKYIGDIEITKRYYYHTNTCTKCGHEISTDAFRAI